MLKRLALLGLILCLFCCSHALASNVLLIVLDDVGADMLDVYRPILLPGVDCEPPDCLPPPPTPTIDSLAANGVMFLNAWANPLCAATRASLTFGRYGLRTGVGSNTAAGVDLDDELAVPEIIPAEIRTAMIGKWGIANGNTWATTGPHGHGFDYGVGGGGPNITNYCEWEKALDGDLGSTIRHVYATSDNVGDAIDWIRSQEGHPWFLHLALNAPHFPLHVPPSFGRCGLEYPLHTYEIPHGGTPKHCDNPLPGMSVYGPMDQLSIRGCPDGKGPTCYRAMLQAADTELGCLLNSIDGDILAETTIILVGDNGTPPGMVDWPLGGEVGNLHRGKGDVSRGGIHVPLIVSGERVIDPGRTSETLVNLSDIYATTAEILTHQKFATLVPDTKIYDSTSFLPTLQGICSEERNWIYAEVFLTGWAALRDPLYKLMLRGVHNSPPTCTVFYDLKADPLELCPLVRTDTTPDEPSCGAESEWYCEPTTHTCSEFPECVRMRDQMDTLIGTAIDNNGMPVDNRVVCRTSTSFCAKAGVSCSFDGNNFLSGLCRAGCGSDIGCLVPDVFPPELALMPECLGN